MPIILGNYTTGNNSIDPSEAFLVKKDFPAVDLLTSETDRDIYYTNNTTELVELDNNPNWAITLTFLDQGIETVVSQVRRNNTWVTVGKGSDIDFASLQEGEVAIYDSLSGKLVGKNIFVTDTGTLVVGTNSLSLGEAHTMSSGYENVFFTNQYNERDFHPVWQDGTMNGDATPTARMYTAPISIKAVIVENGDDKTGTITDPNYMNQVAPNARLFAIYLESATTATNCVATLVDINSGTIVYKILLGTLTANVEKRVEITPPVDVKGSVAVRIELRSDDAPLVLKANSVGTYPWLAFDNQIWEDKPIALVEDLDGGGGLGYVLATYGANVQNTGYYPRINGVANALQISGLGIDASAPVPADGTIDAVTYYMDTGNNTTMFKIIKNGVVAHTFTCVGAYGVETGINVPVAVGDNVALRYDAGMKPAGSLYSIYIK